MARIADETIEKIKNKVSLVRLAETQGHTLKKHGKDFILSCPFHDDKKRSDAAAKIADVVSAAAPQLARGMATLALMNVVKVTP